MSMPETNYEMTQADLDAILDACKPVPAMMIGGMAPRSQQENANNAWAALGQKMGFGHMTVRPIDGKGMRFFTAVPNESEATKQERVAKQKEEARIERIELLAAEICERQAEMTALLHPPTPIL